MILDFFTSLQLLPFSEVYLLIVIVSVHDTNAFSFINRLYGYPEGVAACGPNDIISQIKSNGIPSSLLNIHPSFTQFSYYLIQVIQSPLLFRSTPLGYLLRLCGSNVRNACWQQTS